MERSFTFAIFGLACCLNVGCGSNARELPRGWYFAGSKLEDKNALGGFGPCDNYPKKCANDSLGTKGQLSLIAYPGETVEFRKYDAMPLRLVNRTQEVVGFSACDSSLYIVEEALSEDGQWKALDSLPVTDCGNSCHRVFLEPNEYWEFFAPHRHGSLKKKLRFRLDIGGERGRAEGGTPLYSNEFEGTVDPAQLQR